MKKKVLLKREEAMIVKLVSGKVIDGKAECKIDGVVIKGAKGAELFIPYHQIKYTIKGTPDTELIKIIDA